MELNADSLLANQLYDIKYPRKKARKSNHKEHKGHKEIYVIVVIETTFKITL